MYRRRQRLRRTLAGLFCLLLVAGLFKAYPAWMASNASSLRPGVPGLIYGASTSNTQSGLIKEAFSRIAGNMKKHPIQAP